VRTRHVSYRLDDELIRLGALLGVGGDAARAIIAAIDRELIEDLRLDIGGEGERA
jgi:hypothetical protein